MKLHSQASHFDDLALLPPRHDQGRDMSSQAPRSESEKVRKAVDNINGYAARVVVAAYGHLVRRQFVGPLSRW